MTWEYFDVIEYGTGSHMFGFSSSAPKTFIRLHYMDVATSNPLGGDIDGDGLTNQQEVYTYGTNPFVSDTDGDGIDDLYEVNNNFLDALFAGDALLDPDGDNLVNLWEYKLGLNLAVANTDTDGDGLVDALENFLGRQFSSILSDTDSDGIDDDLEDPDSDEISTLMEFGVYGTNGLLFDTDDDGMNDKWEIVRGFNPLIFVMALGVAENPNADTDGDGLTNQEESEYGTDPNNNDTDNDGVNDSDEIDQGSNPLDSDDDAPPPKGTTPINIRFGDPASSSGSEK